MRSPQGVHALKPTNGLKHRLYNLLNRPALRPMLAGLATLATSARTREFCWVSYDGEWVQRFPSCTLVEPRVTLWTPKGIEKLFQDLWTYKYMPSEGDTVIDVGAGTGWETFFFAKCVGRTGHVISIEAHPQTFRCLSKMCEKNRLANVTLIQAAVGDREGEVLIGDSDEHEGNSIVTSGPGVRVPGLTLDSVCRSLGVSRVDFLKMNIEGAERPALCGMGEMALRTRNVCISCHDFLADEGGSDDLRTRVDVIAFLERNGFATTIRDPEGIWIRDFVYGVNGAFPSP